MGFFRERQMDYWFLKDLQMGLLEIKLINLFRTDLG